MSYARSFAFASRKYRPTRVRILFVAEAPPALESRRFFYFADLRQGDTLFLEMMKTLYSEDVGFSENRFGSGFSAEAIRRRKSELLSRFKSDGFYLIDACEQPMPRGATPALKAALMQKALPALKAKISRICSPETLGVLLIGVVTFQVCADALEAVGVTVLNNAAINHPARGGQVLFRTKLGAVLGALS